MKITKTTPHLTALKELGRRLALVRKQQGFTQAELAKEAGLGVVTVLRMESGQDAQFSSWIKLFNVLGVTPTLDALLPEEILSPMSEVQKQHQRKKPGAKNKNIWGDGKS
jgi:transcriptional regulator with XRE-family HTH domain